MWEWHQNEGRPDCLEKMFFSSLSLFLGKLLLSMKCITFYMKYYTDCNCAAWYFVETLQKKKILSLLMNFFDAYLLNGSINSLPQILNESVNQVHGLRNKMVCFDFMLIKFCRKKNTFKFCLSLTPCCSIFDKLWL